MQFSPAGGEQIHVKIIETDWIVIVLHYMNITTMLRGMNYELLFWVVFLFFAYLSLTYILLYDILCTKQNKMVVVVIYLIFIVDYLLLQLVRYLKDFTNQITCRWST